MSSRARDHFGSFEPKIRKMFTDILSEIQEGQPRSPVSTLWMLVEEPTTVPRVRPTMGYAGVDGPMCSEEVNRIRYGVPHTPNCRGNLAMALGPFGFNYLDIPNAFVPFMNVEVDADGTMEIRGPSVTWTDSDLNPTSWSY